MKNGTEQIWSRLRGVFVDELTFSEIKNGAGSAGIPISGLAHLVQQDGATKDALMSAVDGLFSKLPTDERDGFVADFVREAVERKSRVRERIEPLLERAEEILAAIQSEQDSDSRGVTEILKSPEFNKSFFFAKLTDRGSPYSVPTPQFRRAIRELSEAGWLDEPEDDGNLRVYR